MVPASAPTSGTTSVPFEVTTGSKSGTATITATYNDISTSGIEYVSNATDSSFADFCEVFGNASALEVGAATTYYAYLCVASPVDTTGQIAITTSGVVTAPTTTVQIVANTNENPFPITAVADGTTTIVVTVDGVQEQTTVIVRAPTFSFDYGSAVTLEESYQYEVYLESDTLLASDRAFTLASSNPSVVQLSSASVTIGAGATDAVFGIKGLTTGSANVTAVNGSTTVTIAVTIVAN
jgi:hypothetical protein